MASSPVPRTIVLALGAGVLGFPDALRLLIELDIAGRSPLTDIAICVLAMAVVTAQALGAILLARFVRKAARAGGASPGAPPPRRTDRFAQVTLAVSLGVAFLVSACLLVAPGADAGGLRLLHLIVAGIARKMKSPVIVALTTPAAAVLPCARTLLRAVFRREQDGPAAASSMTQVASFTGSTAFILLVLAVSGGLYAARCGSPVGVAAVVGAVLLARFAFARTAARNNAAGAGGRAALAPAADTRRFGVKLTRLAAYLVVVSFAALIGCLFVLATYAPLESGADGAKCPLAKQVV